MKRSKTSDPVDRLKVYLLENTDDARLFLNALCSRRQPLLLRTQIQEIFSDTMTENKSSGLASSPFKIVVQWCQEAAVLEPRAYFALRKRSARWDYIRIDLETLNLERVSLFQARPRKIIPLKSILPLSPGNFSSCRRKNQSVGGSNSSTEGFQAGYLRNWIEAITASSVFSKYTVTATSSFC